MNLLNFGRASNVVENEHVQHTFRVVSNVIAISLRFLFMSSLLHLIITSNRPHVIELIESELKTNSIYSHPKYSPVPLVAPLLPLDMMGYIYLNGWWVMIKSGIVKCESWLGSFFLLAKDKTDRHPSKPILLASGRKAYVCSQAQIQKTYVSLCNYSHWLSAPH